MPLVHPPLQHIVDLIKTHRERLLKSLHEGTPDYEREQKGDFAAGLELVSLVFGQIRRFGPAIGGIDHLGTLRGGESEALCISKIEGEWQRNLSSVAWCENFLVFLKTRQQQTFAEIEEFLKPYENFHLILRHIEIQYSLEWHNRAWIDHVVSEEDWKKAVQAGKTKERIAVLWQCCLCAQERTAEVPFFVHVAVDELKKPASRSPFRPSARFAPPQTPCLSDRVDGPSLVSERFSPLPESESE